MTCMGTKILGVLRNQELILNQFVKNASISTNCLPQPWKAVTWDPSVYQYNGKRHAHCRRINPCVKKKQIEQERKERDAKKKKGFFASFFEKKKKKPPYETCRLVQQKREWREEPIPEFIKEMCEDLPEGSAIYRTKGHAFVLEVPCKKIPKTKMKTRSEILLSKMERDKQAITLEDETNPMPCYSSVGQRLLDLHARKLHPLYKKLEMPQAKCAIPFKLDAKFACVSEKKVESDSCKKEFLLRKKITFSNFKMTVLPRYLESKEKEYALNFNSALERKKEKDKKLKRVKPATECPPIDCDRWNNQPPRREKPLF